MYMYFILNMRRSSDATLNQNWSKNVMLKNPESKKKLMFNFFKNTTPT
jgi:hypothetical protein